jgi:hypothetical protein
VEQFEKYYAELKLKVEELRPLLLRLSKREVIVEEKIELEHSMQNPERLTDSQHVDRMPERKGKYPFWGQSVREISCRYRMCVNSFGIIPTSVRTSEYA